MRTDDHPAVEGEALAKDLAYRFTSTLVARDAAALRSLFGTEVDFRALTPGHVWEAATPDELVHDVILGCWFKPSDVIQQVESVQHEQIGTRTRFGYRLQVQNAGETFTVEQQAFCDVSGGTITWLRVMCSGFMPVPSASANREAQLEGSQP